MTVGLGETEILGNKQELASMGPWYNKQSE